MDLVYYIDIHINFYINTLDMNIYIYIFSFCHSYINYYSIIWGSS